MTEKTNYLKVKDHSVSGEIFELRYNEELELLQTHPQPISEILPSYYQSEDYISHTDGKRNLFENVYHFVKSIALKRKLKLINSLQNGSKNLLDVGCGTGDFLKIAKEGQWTITGVEPNVQAREIANIKTANSVFDIEQLTKIKPESFDVISLWHVLEHLPELEIQMVQLRQLLKVEGSLVIAVPNYKSYDANYYQEFWAAYDVPRHLWHFSKLSIAKLVTKYNMEVVQILPMKFDAYYVSLLSEKYKFGNMNLLRAFRIGWKSNRRARGSGEYSSLIYVVKKKIIDLKPSAFIKRAQNER